VLGIVALLVFLASIIAIVLVVLVAIVFAEGIRPLVQRLRARNIPQAMGIVIVYVGGGVTATADAQPLRRLRLRRSRHARRGRTIGLIDQVVEVEFERADCFVGIDSVQFRTGRVDNGRGLQAVEVSAVAVRPAVAQRFFHSASGCLAGCARSKASSCMQLSNTRMVTGYGARSLS